MTQEEKAKAYDEALKVMRQWIAPCHTPEQLEAMKKSVFPELRESEDERIRKEIVGVIQKHYPNTPESYRWISWLEKQKETLHISETCKENADSFTDEQKVPDCCLKCNEYEIGYKAGYEHGCTAGYNKAIVLPQSMMW